MNDVKNIEAFFDIEFSAEQLMNAIESMHYYDDEIRQVYGLSEENNPEKTYILGVLAETAVNSKYSDFKLRNDYSYNDYMQICMDIAKDKYSSFAEVKPKFDKFYDEKNYFSKDMQNLEKVLEQWNSLVLETRDGTKIQCAAGSTIWIDNWRMSALNDFGSTNNDAWQINYKSLPLVDYNPYRYEATIHELNKDNPIVSNSKLNLGDVLQSIQTKLNIFCPEIEPQKGKIPVYKPTGLYFTDQLESKEKTVLESLQHEDFYDNSLNVKIQLNEKFKKENGIYKNLEVCKVLPVSRHPDDKHLYCIMAQNSDTKEYTVWTSYNSDTSSLNNGHYNIKSMNDAAKLMCQFSNIDKPLHIEHHQQYKHESINEIER
jgi:hypothetical protein